MDAFPFASTLARAGPIETLLVTVFQVIDVKEFYLLCQQSDYRHKQHVAWINAARRRNDR